MSTPTIPPTIPGAIPQQSSKATLAVVLGVLGIICCGLLAPAAWYLASEELKAISAGRLSEANRGWMNIWNVGVDGRDYKWVRETVIECLQGRREPLVTKPLPADYVTIAIPEISGPIADDLTSPPNGLPSETPDAAATTVVPAEPTGPPPAPRTPSRGSGRK